MSVLLLPADDPGAIAQAARILRDGGLVAFPTETVYGLGADAFDAAAVARIFAAKGRPTFDPLIVHLADRTWLERVVGHTPEAALRLAARFWPGPLTLVLPKRRGRPRPGDRGPRHRRRPRARSPAARALIAAADRPIAAPSANLFGYVSPTTAAHVVEQLGDRVDAVLDGGPCRVGVESTIVSFASGAPVVLRPGGVTREDLAEALGGPVGLARERVTGDAPLVAPGQLDRHYATRTPLRLLSGRAQGPGSTARVGLLAFAAAPASGFAAVEVLAPDGQPATAAAQPVRGAPTARRVWARPSPGRALLRGGPRLGNHGPPAALRRGRGLKPGGAMVLKWFGGSKESTIEELIARKKYARAVELLRARFRAGSRDPLLRQQLADVLVLAGKQKEAVPIIIGLADEYAFDGQAAKAIALLKKLELLEKTPSEVEGRLAALIPQDREAPRPSPSTAATLEVEWDEVSPSGTEPTSEGARFAETEAPMTEEDFGRTLVEVAHEALENLPARPSAPTAGPVIASPLFSDFSEAELRAVIRGLRLLTFEPGDIILSEGEPGETVFVLATGAVKAFVRNPEGSLRLVREMGEGSFFGEISILSGAPRTATVTAAARCEVLELDRPTLDEIADRHPGVWPVLVQFAEQRAGSREEERIRTEAAAGAED